MWNYSITYQPLQKDIAALCKRVVIIARGRIQYDGSLAGVIDQFSGHKLLTFEFVNGEIVEATWPKIQIRLLEVKFQKSLEKFYNYAIEDVSVEDVPLEEVIATMFRISSDGLEHAIDDSLILAK